MTAATPELRKTSRELPEGVGRFTPGWTIVVLVAAAALLVGVFVYARQFMQGFVVTDLRDVGTRRGAPWGLYIAFDVYFVGVSFAGITVAAVIRLFNLKFLRPVSRMAEVLTISALILASFAIMADLGQPLRGLTNLLKYARPQSPFFGTFTLVVGGYLFASLVYLFLDGRRDAAILAEQPSGLQWYHRAWATGYKDTPAERERHQRTSFWLAIAIIPLLVIAHSTLGFIFGVQGGRPGWYSALQAPAFVIMAGVSGIGLVIVLAAAVRSIYRKADLLNERVFRWLGLVLMLLIIVYLYFMVTEMLTTRYAAQVKETEVTESLISGTYAWVFWTAVALLVIPLGLLIWQAVARRWRVGVLVAVGIGVNIAAILKRLLIVVPSLTKGTLLPYGEGSYVPSGTEILIIVGLFGMGVLLVTLFMKTFPVIDLRLWENGNGEDESGGTEGSVETADTETP